MGHFQDAVTSYEAIMEGSPDYQAGEVDHFSLT
jgi:hypothetical protein